MTQKKRTPEKWTRQQEPFVRSRLLTPRLYRDLEIIDPPERFPELDLPEGEGYFLFGEVKSGKTVFAAQLLLDIARHHWLEEMHNQQLIFINTGDLFEEIKQTFEPTSKKTEQEVKEKYKNADVLVLDDLGAGGKISDWFINTLYLIINHRYEQLLPTIITSNQSLEELEELFGDSRITSRIERMCRIAKKSHWNK